MYMYKYINYIYIYIYIYIYFGHRCTVMKQRLRTSIDR